MKTPSDGFTLLEVLVALVIVAIALASGVRATQALSNNAQRQVDIMLAQICADNQLTQLRLARQFPGLGESSIECEQAGRRWSTRQTVQPTPNPMFVRIDVQVFDERGPLLRVSTVQGRY